MLRRTLTRLLPLAEARRLFLAPDGQPLPAPMAPLPTILEAIQTNYKAMPHDGNGNNDGGVKEREALISAAMQHVVQLDQENTDSEMLASWMEDAPQRIAAVPTTEEEGRDGTQIPKQVHTVVALMKAFPNNMAIREVCCRCIANICQLSPAVSVSTSARRSEDDNSGDDAAYHRALDRSFAEALVREGAVEQCVGTMAAMHRLSRRGRCWAALSILNLVCLSRSGAARAAGTAKGEEVLSEFILFLLAESMEGGVLVDTDGLTGIALDAALGALSGLLAAEAPENDKGHSYNYDKISYTAVDAVVRSLLATSTLLIRDGRNNGAYNASLPNRRYGGSTSFLTASELQQRSVATLLPPLHKGWMSLQLAASNPANLPMIFDCLYEAANTNQESGGRVVDGDDVNDIEEGEGKGSSAMRSASGSDGGDVLVVSAQTERRHVAALTNMLEAALFLVTELEHLQEASPELAKLQNDLCLSVMTVMSTMTATRKDIQQTKKAATSSVQREAGENVDAADTHDDEESDLSAVLPTPAALGVTGVLASGLVSSMALATAVRLHSEQQQQEGEAGEDASKECSHATPYRSERFALLSKSLLVLSHLGEAGDEVAVSANTVAALQAMLKEAAQVAASCPFYYQGDVTALFKPTDYEGSDSSNGVSGGKPLAPRHRLALLQQFALVGQVYAVLYSVLRTPQGIALVTQLDVPATAADMQRSLVHVYGKAIREARKRYGGDRGGGGGENKKGKWVATAAEESVLRLTTLGDELISTLAKLTPRPPGA